MNKPIEDVRKMIESVYSIKNASPWTIEQVFKYAEALFQFAKFKVGDRVEMAETYPVSLETCWGWWSYRHLLKEGSKATVREVDYIDGGFEYSVQFDERSYMSDQGEVRPISEDMSFHLTERWLRPVTHR